MMIRAIRLASLLLLWQTGAGQPVRYAPGFSPDSTTDQPFISFEYFPPKTPEGVVKLHKVIDEMCKQKPLFVDFTWGAGGSSADLTLELSKTSQQKHNVMVSGAATAAPVALRPPAAPVPSPVRARGVRVR